MLVSQRRGRRPPRSPGSGGAATATARPGTASPAEEELETRTACPAHRAQLSGDALRKGALYQPVPGWA